jgi:hypothetical protein
MSRGLQLAALVAGFTVSRAASAQLGTGTGSTSSLGITINPTVPRFATNGTTPYPYRPANLNPNDINFQDCSANIVLEFELIESGLPTTDTLQVWAGPTDCTQQSARVSGTSGPFCWRVAPNAANSQTAAVNIYARNLTQFVDNTSSAVLAYNPSPGTTPGVDACHTQQASGAVGLTIYFMFIEGDDITLDASATYPLNVDMVGPLAPQSLTAGIGDTLLILNWSPQTDSTIQGFNLYIQDQGVGGLGAGSEAGSSSLETPIYCPTAGTTTTCVDAGTRDGAVIDAGCTTTVSGDASFSIVADASSLMNATDADLAKEGCYRGAPRYTFDAGGPGAASCVSTVLVDTFSTTVTASATDGGFVDGSASVVVPLSTDAGVSGGTVGVGISEIPDADLAASVGGNTTSSYTLTTLPDGGPLINGHQYALAVAAFDDDGNVGLLSNLACQTPAPVVDFWNEYGRAGGLAGGGFCTLQGAGIPAFGSVFGVGVGLAAVAFARRRRRRNS